MKFSAMNMKMKAVKRKPLTLNQMRSACSLAGLLWLLAGPLWAGQQGHEALAHGEYALSVTQDLSAYAEVSRREGVPVLVMFSSPGCDYCDRLEANVLHPMTRNGEHPARVLIAKVRVANGIQLRDFDGSLISAEALSARHGARVYPTVALVDGAGRALAPNLVGYGSVDFYDAYLDNAIAASQQALATVTAHP